MGVGLTNRNSSATTGMSYQTVQYNRKNQIIYRRKSLSGIIIRPRNTILSLVIGVAWPLVGRRQARLNLLGVDNWVRHFEHGAECLHLLIERLNRLGTAHVLTNVGLVFGSEHGAG